MKKRRKFAPEFKAKVALEALAGELTLAELAAKHDIHPNVIQQWRRHAKESMPDLFSGKAAAHQTSREDEIKDLRAKIGELTIEKDFWPEPSVAEPRSEGDDDRSESSTAQYRSPVRAGDDQSLIILLRGQGRNGPEPRADASDRRGVSGEPVLRVSADDTASPAAGLLRWPQADSALDAQDGPDADLPETSYF